MTNVVAATTSPVYIEITDSTSGTTTVESDKLVSPVQVATAGPRGPAGPQGPAGLGMPVIMDGATTGSILYYNAEIASFKADASRTFLTTTDGGNF